jgi:hypothetical protein
MNTYLKTSCVAALALAMTTFGAVQARAGGWAVAGGVLGGVAVGTAIGATVATAAAQPAYYAYPPSVYAPGPYYAPVGAYAAAPAYYYGPRVVIGAPYPYYRPFFRGGYAWGPHYFRGGRFYRR